MNSCNCKECNSEITFNRKCDYARFMNNKSFLCLSCYKKNWTKLNRSKKLLASKKWRDNNKDKQTEYWLNNKEKITIRTNIWRINNKDRLIAYRNLLKTKLKKRNLDNLRRTTMLNTDIDHLYLQDLYNKSNVCIYCNRTMQEHTYNYDDYKTIDHITPITKNGLHIKSNIQIICMKCNSSKNNKTHEEYINISRN